MEKVLVLKTASDSVVNQLLKELDNGNTQIDCLIQSSLMERYIKEYTNINFINIHQEHFYHLPDDVIQRVSAISYDKVFIPFTGVNGYNFENVMELVSSLSFKQGLFYNCNGDINEIPKYGRFNDWLCLLFIRFMNFIYGRNEG